ncbi:MAG: leucine-rich repeat protein [Clostridia bacterium]|nr:leucine-rich repeat protein [Clostridia bacterium]
MKKLLLSVFILLLATTALADVTLPENVMVIEPEAFAGCTELTGTLVIPEGVTDIGEEAFKDCAGLTELVLPSNAVTIEDRAFAGCTELAGAVVGDNVSLGEDVFDGTDITVMESTPLEAFEYAVGEDGTVTITRYVGESEDGVVVIPDEIEGCPVTVIGPSAFQQQWVTQVYLPAGLKRLEKSAFESCSSMTAVWGGRNVTYYGDNAFFYCTALETLKINAAADYFGEYAFGYCEKLQDTLYLSADQNFTAFSFIGADIVALGFEVRGDTVAQKQRFGGQLRDHLVIPSTYKGLPVTEIIDTEYGYSHDGPARRLTIPATVKTIGYAAFHSCSDGLVHVDFEENSQLERIETYAFSGMNNLERVDLPPSLKHIGDDVFKYDYKLSTLSLPEGLETLGSSCFWFTLIPEINIPEAWTELPPYCFYGMGLTEFTIPERITKLGTAALGGTKLTSITIPETVTEIGDYTFAGCTELTDVTLPGNMTVLPFAAFSECTSLKTVELPDSITEIGLFAFNGSTSLEKVDIPPEVTVISPCVFENTGIRTNAVARVVAECITDDMTEFEKALALHDWLINNADYTTHCTFFGAEGVLVYGEGVCQSYTDAYAMLLDAVGVAHKPVVSASMNHTWNLVQLDGEWYHVDCTWDDPLDGTEQHIYFGLTDALMGQDHTWDDPDSLPAATGTRYQYGVDNGQ